MPECHQTYSLAQNSYLPHPPSVALSKPPGYRSVGERSKLWSIPGISLYGPSKTSSGRGSPPHKGLQLQEVEAAVRDEIVTDCGSLPRGACERHLWGNGPRDQLGGCASCRGRTMLGGDSASRPWSSWQQRTKWQRSRIGTLGRWASYPEGWGWSQGGSEWKGGSKYIASCRRAVVEWGKLPSWRAVTASLASLSSFDGPSEAKRRQHKWKRGWRWETPSKPEAWFLPVPQSPWTWSVYN